MKKMIVSDMDGTLLNNHQILSERSKKVLRKLTEKGIHFSAASGRSRRSLKEHFENIPFASISDNGATLYDEEDNLIWYSKIPIELLKSMWKTIKKASFLHPVFCGLSMHYVLQSEDEAAKQKAFHFFNGHVEIVNNVEEVFEKDTIVKLSLSTMEDGSEEEATLALLQPLRDQVTITLSGGGWIDVTDIGATKGIAYEKLCEHLKIERNETMMFGDYLNDYEMLKRCPDSWCMKNGHPEVKKICAHITEYTNDEDGVAKELERIFRYNL